MSRVITLGAAQLGPIARLEPRESVVERLLLLMRQARAMGAELVVFPELALTTFFPRWVIEDEAELDRFYETEMPGPATRPLFEEAARLGIGFYLGYAELDWETGAKRRFNTSILVDRTGRIIGKYRKVHLPGTAEADPTRTVHHLEKRYFLPGDLGFPVWRAFGGIVGMCICNDRRWVETYRVMALQGAELILLGYNTPVGFSAVQTHRDLACFHNHLVMQAGAYQNSAWVVGVAKAGCEEGSDLIGQSAIIAPSGEIAAQCVTVGDELIVSRVDLDLAASYKALMFDFEANRAPRHYGLITATRGAVPPPEN